MVRIEKSRYHLCSIIDTETVRLANIPLCLSLDIFNKVYGLSLIKVKLMCSDSVFKKSKQFDVVKSDLIFTQVLSSQNKIEGQFRAAMIHDQNMDWTDSVDNSPFIFFCNLTVSASCSCKYQLKITKETARNKHIYCSHIIRQLRKVFLMTIFFKAFI